MKKIALTLGLWFVAAVAWGASDDFPTLKLQNWHQWRGPLANGVAPLGNPPTHWDENTNIKWKAKIPGESTATPIVWGDQIFLITAIKTDREVELPPPPKDPPKNPFNVQRPKNFYQFVVMSIDRRTGQTRWQQLAKEEVPHEGHHHDGSFASASPMTDGKQLYVSFGSRGVYCYDLAGRQKWSRDLGKMTIYNLLGEGCSPVVHGNTVIVNWDHQGGSFITALDAKTGETQWKGGGQAMAAIPCPVSDDRLVFAMTGYMGNALYAIPLDSAGDITDTDKVAWKRKEPGTPYVPSPLLYGDLLYFTSSNKGILSVLNANSGDPVINRTRLEGVANIYASPVAAADQIYLTSREGNTLVIKKGPELEILSTNKLDGVFDCSPVIVGNQIILRGRENLYCISAE